MKSLKTAAILGAASVLLTACGGSGDSDKSKAPNVNATNTTASHSSTPGSTASPTDSASSGGSHSASPSASSSGSPSSSGSTSYTKDSMGKLVPVPASSTSQSAKDSSSASPSSSSSKGKASGSSSPKASASPKARVISKDDLGGSDCAMLPATSTKSPSFTLKGTKANVTKDNSELTFTFSKDFTEKLFSDEASKTKAKEYGFRLVNADGDNLIYSFKSHKAFKLATTGPNAGKQQELPSVKVATAGKALKVTIPQKDFAFTKKAWGAEEFFYADNNNIFLSSCEKRNS